MPFHKTRPNSAYSNIKVWQDANHNGITDAGELKTLTELGITSINLNQTSQSGLVRDGNEILASSTFTQTINGISTTKEALAANFIANPNGSTFTSSGTGTLTTTQGSNTSTIKSYTAANPITGQTTGEIIDVTAKGVNNAQGGSGNDTLTGDANANWLAGGLGADTINAGAGDDVILFDSADTIDGGDGNDVAQVMGDSGVVLNLAQSHIEVAIGGRGDDILIGGGRSTVFIKGGAGDDIIIGGAANDVLSGEDGADLIDGGAGNDLIRGQRGQDQLMGGAGDDVVDGGQDDDKLSGGDGNDVLIGGQGDDVLDGGAGIDVAQFSGSYADYRITKLSDTNGGTYRIVDTKSGRDGADTLTNIERLVFADVAGVDLTLDNPMPVKDVITIDNRSGLKLIKVADLLANDRDWQGDAIHLTTISDIVGGSIVGTYNATSKEWTPTLTANGELQFTPDANYQGVMSFRYKVADVDNTAGASFVQYSTGNLAELRAQVFIKTPDMPTDPLFTDQWYLNDINATAVWNSSNGQGYTGKGIKIGQFETGSSFSTTTRSEASLRLEMLKNEKACMVRAFCNQNKVKLRVVANDNQWGIAA